MSEQPGRRIGVPIAMPVPPAPVSTGELDTLFREYHGVVFRAALRVTGNAADAEDVLQTVFLRLARREAATEAMEAPESYLRRAAVNAALDLVRARQAARQTPLESVAPALPETASRAPDRLLAAGEIRQWLRQAVAGLHPTAAAVFVLRFFEGLENSEIARTLGTTPGSVAVTLSRTRDRLEKEYRTYMGELR